MPTKQPEYIRPVMWAQDLVTACASRPWWARMLLRFAMGKYAYREFIGLIEWLREGADLYFFLPYDLQNCEYHHNRTVPVDFLDEIKRLTQRDIDLWHKTHPQ